MAWLREWAGSRAGRPTRAPEVDSPSSAVLKKCRGAAERESADSPGGIQVGSLEAVAFEMGFEEWEHMAETQEQF